MYFSSLYAGITIEYLGIIFFISVFILYHNGIIKYIVNRVKEHKISRFALIGIINTLSDFILLNILRVLTHTQTNQSARLITLNIISASSVAILSFYLNRKYVFNANEVRNQMFIPFLAVTLVGIFILQSIIIGFSLKLFDPLAELLMDIGSVIPVVKNFTFNFYEANLAKAFATLASMTWNYYFYNKVIFK